MNQIDPHAHLRAAFTAGCRIQAWHLNDGAANSNNGRWDTLTPPEGREPEFGCAPHLYRVHPEDEAKALAAWKYQHPTMHLPEGVRFYIERLVSNTDPAGMVRENIQLRETVKQLSLDAEMAAAGDRGLEPPRGTVFASDVDLMRDVYMSKAQREAYERILAVAQGAQA